MMMKGIQYNPMNQNLFHMKLNPKNMKQNQNIMKLNLNIMIQSQKNMN